MYKALLYSALLFHESPRVGTLRRISWEHFVRILIKYNLQTPFFIFNIVNIAIATFRNTAIANSRGFPADLGNIPRMYLHGKKWRRPWQEASKCHKCALFVEKKIVLSQLIKNVQRLHIKMHTISPPPYCSKCMLWVMWPRKRNVSELCRKALRRCD